MGELLSPVGLPRLFLCLFLFVCLLPLLFVLIFLTPQLALLAGLVGLQVPWVTLLTCCQIYQVHNHLQTLGDVWPCQTYTSMQRRGPDFH